MSKINVEKKLTRNGEVVNVKLSPKTTQKYQTSKLYEKCVICGNYYEDDLGCSCSMDLDVPEADFGNKSILS